MRSKHIVRLSKDDRHLSFRQRKWVSNAKGI
jgi:hypothetical protein